MRFNFKPIKTEYQRIQQRQELIPYILEYLKTHNYIRSKTIANTYFQKNNIKNFSDLERFNILKMLTLKISGYFGTLTREGYIKSYSNGHSKMYKKTDNMVKGFNELLNGKKMTKHWKGHIQTRTDILPRLEWKKLKDLENDENNLYFLGTLKKVDPHFKYLYKTKNKNYNIKHKKIRMTENEELLKFTINYLLTHKMYSNLILTNTYIDKLMDFNPNLSRSLYIKQLTKKFEKIITDLKIKPVKIDTFYVSNKKTIQLLKKKLNSLKVIKNTK